MIPEHQLTGWYSSKESYPERIGEYNASTMKHPGMFRWWNGEWWSAPYSQKLSERGRRRLRRMRSSITENPIYFRGLKHKPKVSTLSYLRPLQD